MKIPKTFIPEKNLEENIRRLSLKKHPIVYNNYKRLKIERGVKKDDLYFDESLELLRKKGYERHLRPWEHFSLIIDYYEGKLEKGLARLAKNMLEGYGGWFSMAVKREGDSLICYVDPENLEWDNTNNKYVINGKLEYSDKKELDIRGIPSGIWGGIPSGIWACLEEFDDDFVKYFYTRKFKDLPVEMKKGEIMIHLPSSYGILWPVSCSSNSMLDIKTEYTSRASRGARIKK